MMVHIAVEKGRIVVSQIGIIALYGYHVAAKRGHPCRIGNFKKLEGLTSGLPCYNGGKGEQKKAYLRDPVS